MSRDDIAKAIATELAQQLPHNTLHTTSQEDLDAAMTYAAKTYRNFPVVMGQLAAELYRRDRLNNSLRKIAKRYGIPPTTLTRWAKPFLDNNP
jgi:hypothetical protein